jgi:hypothetical protein
LLASEELEMEAFEEVEALESVRAREEGEVETRPSPRTSES